ncbi:helix-turn-helix domain-containing protein [Nocardiopsis nanhaiensis]
MTNTPPGSARSGSTRPDGMRPGPAAPGGQRSRPVGDLLREWRGRRRFSQLALSLEADISTRHLSFVETGRSQPSREMVLRLCETLQVPLRERNRLLLAAGYAPEFPEAPPDGPGLESLRTTVRAILTGHEPYPAVVLDSDWNLLEANAAVPLLLEGVSAELLTAPVNVLRVALHPDGMAPRLLNFGRWRAHLLDRLRREAEWTGEGDLRALLRELSDYPAPDPRGDDLAPEPTELAVPLRLRTSQGDLSFLSTVATFGTAVDVTVAGLAIETFLPADPATAEVLRGSAL